VQSVGSRSTRRCSSVRWRSSESTDAPVVPGPSFAPPTRRGNFFLGEAL
jgi:hypothetical protein